ncbi:hypothetical protein [Turneriella parva]|uniref:hypothetical protein n=1 Tax=Turneriella parva TaxID=29510 RepID=UPI0012F67ACC|nr:hypothetical protein [Turneriella parva]
MPTRERDVASIGQGPIAFKLAMRGLRSRNTEFEQIAGFLTLTNLETRSAHRAVVLAPVAKL